MLTTSEMEDPQTGALLCPECAAANLPQRKYLRQVRDLAVGDVLPVRRGVRGGRELLRRLRREPRRSRRRAARKRRCRPPRGGRNAGRLPLRGGPGGSQPHRQARSPPAGRAGRPGKAAQPSIADGAAAGADRRPRGRRPRPPMLRRLRLRRRRPADRPGPAAAAERGTRIAAGGHCRAEAGNRRLGAASCAGRSTKNASSICRPGSSNCSP